MGAMYASADGGLAHTIIMSAPLLARYQLRTSASTGLRDRELVSTASSSCRSVLHLPASRPCGMTESEPPVSGRPHPMHPPAQLVGRIQHCRHTPSHTLQHERAGTEDGPAGRRPRRCTRIESQRPSSLLVDSPPHLRLPATSLSLSVSLTAHRRRGSGWLQYSSAVMSAAVEGWARSCFGATGRWVIAGCSSTSMCRRSALSRGHGRARRIARCFGRRRASKVG